MPTEHCHPSKLSAPRRGELHPASGRRGFIRMRPVIRLLPVVVLLPVISAGTPTPAPGFSPAEPAHQPLALPVPSRGPSAESYEVLRLAQNAPVLHVARVFVMEPGTEIPLPIQVEAMPRNSFLRLRGLPSNATLSEGHQIGPGAWAVPLVSLPNIRVRVPRESTGRFEVSISAVNVAGDILSEIKTTLVVASSSSLLAGLSEQPAETPAPTLPQPPAPTLAERTDAGQPSATDTSASGMGGQPPLSSASAANIQPPSSKSCGAAEISTAALPAAHMAISIKATDCRANEPVTIEYAGARFVRQLDEAGELSFTLDCFAGTSSKVLISFADGARGAIDVTARDLGRVSKVAVIWKAPVNLDLHAFEYAASYGEPGHVWAASPSSPNDAWEKTLATGRGHGFITAADGNAEGDKYEVYTFWHHEEQTSGAIEMAVDFESRGDTPSGDMCGNGPLSQVAFEVVMLSRHGEVTRQQAMMLPMECGATLTQSARYNKSVIPVLRVRR